MKSPSYIRTRPRSRQFEHRKATLSKSQLVKLDVLKYLKPLHNVVVQQSRPGSECQSRFVGLCERASRRSPALQKRWRTALALDATSDGRRPLSRQNSAIACATILGSWNWRSSAAESASTICDRVRATDRVTTQCPASPACASHALWAIPARGAMTISAGRIRVRSSIIDTSPGAACCPKRTSMTICPCKRDTITDRSQQHTSFPAPHRVIYICARHRSSSSS